MLGGRKAIQLCINLATRGSKKTMQAFDPETSQVHKDKQGQP
jgi:hypothetical protein